MPAQAEKSGAAIFVEFGRCLSRPLLTYAGVEAVAALLAAFSVLLIPTSHGVRALAAVPQSHLLRKRYRDLLFDWAAAAGKDGNPIAAAGMYRRGLQHAPEMTEVSIQLAILKGDLPRRYQYSTQRRQPSTQGLVGRRAWRPACRTQWPR